MLASIMISVATAQANIFSNNGHSVPNKIAKLLEIFEKVEEPKSQGVIF